MCRDVYERIFRGDICIYKKRVDKDWCKCELHMCLQACSNSFMCGHEQEFRCLLASNDGRCRTCQILLGQNIQRVPWYEQRRMCCVCCCEKGTCRIGADNSVFCLDCIKSIFF